MYRGSNILGKVVVTYDTGERVERVQDLIFDQERNQILGFLVREGGLFQSARVIPFENVAAIGNSAVVIPSREVIISAREHDRIHSILKGDNILRGTRILTVKGRDLGTIVDLYFDPQTGNVEGYEVSGGVFADAYSGRSFVPAPQTLHIGEHVAFVPVEIADLMDEQLGGLRAAVQTTNKSLSETSESASRKLQEVAQATQAKLQETAEMANRTLQESSRMAIASLTNAVVDPNEQKAFMLGRVANENVVSTDGVFVVSEGQIVTSEDILRAEEQGVLDLVYRATGGRVTEELNRRLQETTDVTSRKLQEITRVASDRLQSSSGAASEKLQDITRSTAAALTNAVVDPAEQKALVIGKQVSRDVYAPDGSLVAAEGQQVTTWMVSEAERYGVLDDLFRAAGGSLTTELTRAANNILASRLLEQAKGRRVRHTVQTPDGLIVAAPGQIVTSAVVDRARQFDQEESLLVAVGLTPAEAARAGAKDNFASTREQMQEGFSQLSDTASSLVDNLQRQFSVWQVQASQRYEDYQVKRALGRPVSRVILDRNDNVILNVGDLITHRAIARARDAGVLDVLLDSIYTRRPELAMSADVHLPEESGEAARDRMPVIHQVR